MLWPWRRLAPTHLLTGAKGERLAARFLRRAGYRVLHRNFRAGRDEADLIMLDPDGRTVVVVEVKTRRSDQIAPEERVNREKRFKMVRLAAHLQRLREFRGLPLRFDMIAIIWPERGKPVIRHHPAAFESPY